MTTDTTTRYCADCGADIDGNDPHGPGCPSDRGDVSGWPIHRPIAPDAPIPGRHWYGGCDPDHPRVTPEGVCLGCGEIACPECGHGFYPDGECDCPKAAA